MLDSTARAERLDTTPSEVAFYTWEVAQKPVAVRLPLALIDRLESEAVETFRSLTSRGSEIGGLLLGSVAAGNPSVVTVADFELIACDYSRGPLYRLSDPDLGRFEQAIEKRAASGPRVVGYFRSHTRKGLLLDAEDLAFFEPRFLEPQHIVLLVRPFATKSSTAGIFIRENGRIGTETSYLEFPFRSSELGGNRSGAEKSEPAAAQAPPAAGAQPAAPGKAQSRAQIVPIASRREIALPEPVASAPPPPLVADRIEAPAPAPPAKAEPAPPVEPAKEKEKASAPVVEPEPKPAPVAAAVEESVAPIVASGNKSNKKVRLTVAAAIGMLVLVGGSLVVYPMLRSKLSPRPGAAQDSSPLSLHVDRTSGGMQLTWNRDLPAIQNASKVVLSITDGDRHEDVQLDPAEVRNGGFVYSPITGNVIFQMQVTDAHQSKTTSESLRLFDPRPSPLADPAAPDPAAKQPAAAAAKTPTSTPAAASTPAPTPTETPAAAADSNPPEETPAPRSNVALKPFDAQSLAQRLRPTSSPSPAAALPDAPVMARANTPSSNSIPGILSSQASPALPAPPKPGANTPASPAPTGGKIVAAQVISRVDPVYPRFAQQSGAGGLVEVEATITVDGKVKNPHVVHGSVMLQKAAIDAVLQWHYRPATLNGKAIESPVDIKLNFVQAH